MKAEQPNVIPSGRTYEPPSHYVDDAFYEWLVEISQELVAAELESRQVSDPDIALAIERLLLTESRLLDQHEFDRWIELYVPECVYWIPATWPALDPRCSITLEFHDRRRLLDRIARLATGAAYSQIPASRTARLFGRPEVWADPRQSDQWLARCSFLTAETRRGGSRVLAGWNGFVIRQTSNGLRLVVKQINLIDCDQAQGNNSFFL